MSVASAVETVGRDIVHGAEWPFKHAAEVVRALEVAMKDAPAAKDAVMGLVKTFLTISPDVMAVVEARGFNLPEDVQVLADVKLFFGYFLHTFLPEVKTIVGDVEQIEGASATTQLQATETAAADAPPVPGLHNVVPA